MTNAPDYDALRPQSLQDYVGQDHLKRRLATHIVSARERGDRLPHMLFIAAPGQGKTTLSNLIAAEMHTEFLSFVMPIQPSLLRGIMNDFTGIVFFDELHRMRDQEVLLNVLEDHYFQDSNGNRVYNNDVTFIGATTEGDQIIGPLYDRFMVPPFDPYTDDEVAQIVRDMFRRVSETENIPLHADEEMVTVLAKAAAKSPRMAGQFVTTTRDMFVDVGVMPTAEEVLDMLRITKTGLTSEHVRYLQALQSLGGTGGVNLVSSHLRMPEDRLKALERLLFDQHLITYTTRGRQLTMQGSTAVRGGLHV